MEDKVIEEFIEKVKIASTIQNNVPIDTIYQMIDVYDKDYQRVIYSTEIDNPLKIALSFYKYYNKSFYKIILYGLKNNMIIISEQSKRSYFNISKNRVVISLHENDGDVFTIIHELAHFVDKNSTPQIIPNEYKFFSEVYSFYLEKQFELWYAKKDYSDIISSKINNRLFLEQELLKAIKNILYYEYLYNKNGCIEKEAISLSTIKIVSLYKTKNDIVNYLLRYPIANIISDYIINNNLITPYSIFYQECLIVDLNAALNEFSKKRIIKTTNTRFI